MTYYKIAKKKTKYLCYFCKKCCQGLSKIDQSGHTATHLDEHRVLEYKEACDIFHKTFFFVHNCSHLDVIYGIFPISVENCCQSIDAIQNLQVMVRYNDMKLASVVGVMIGYS